MRISIERVRYQSNYDYYLLLITYYLLPITYSPLLLLPYSRASAPLPLWNLPFLQPSGKHGKRVLRYAAYTYG